MIATRKKSTAKSPKKKQAKGTRSEPKAAANSKAIKAPAQVASDRQRFPVVGVGASAGGFEAFVELLQALPSDTGMAFVFVPHLDPSHKSMMVNLLSRKSPMPVCEVTEGLKVEPDHVYVIPPNMNMGIRKGVLQLLGRKDGKRRNLPIDYFLTSLAGDLREWAIGVILSGTASDGTQGLKAIKTEGGVTFAQDEESAKYDGMPRSAIAAGCVDCTLPPAKIAEELVRIAQHGYGEPPVIEMADPSVMEVNMARLLTMIRNATGADFTHYKPNTIRRRIARRMLLKKIDNLRRYVELVSSDQQELNLLYQDFLIHVTSFFREPDSYETLSRTILPKILEKRAPDEPFRVWVPGCSTGEEVYSLAIVLTEFLGGPGGKTQVQIFGTDLSEEAIDKARAGWYPEAISEDLTEQRLRRFFVRSDGGYRVQQYLRELCVFAKQDLTRDPPFSRLDLISCRNVMIYLEPVLQKRILGIFHYALKSQGYLMLGKSETLGAHGELFTMVDKKGKFFAKRQVPAALEFGPATPPDEAARLAEIFDRTERPALDLQREADRMVWNRFSHAGLIINDNLEILHFRGDTSPYLAPMSGAASLQLLKMLRTDLMLDVRTAIHTAKKEGRPARKEGVKLGTGAGALIIDLEVLPMAAPDSTRFYLVLFDQREKARLGPETPSEETAQAKEPAAAGEAEIERLKQELAATKEYLQTIIEEQEATNEELKSANEEILSSNEELQSSNEELETAKEELQSANEELVTVNEQQANQNAELAQANNDLKNVLDGVQIPILMLDEGGKIRRFTSSAAKVFNLLPTDIGRPISNLKPAFEASNLDRLIERTLETLQPQEDDVCDVNGRFYSLRSQPYRTADNRIEGVLLALTDIDALKKSLLETAKARDFSNAILETIREPLAVLDSRLRVVWATNAFYSTFRLTPDETVGELFFNLLQWNIPTLRKSLRAVVDDNAKIDDFLMKYESPELGRKELLLNAKRLEWQAADKGMVVVVVQDSSERIAMREALGLSEAKLRRLSVGLLQAQEEERRKISLDLHDDLNQKLAMLEVEVGILEKGVPETEEILRKQLAALRSRTTQISEDVRKTAHRLHPTVVEHLGLPTALRSLCEDFSKEERLKVTFRRRNIEKEIPPEIGLCLFRVAQESLRNVVRHSGSRRASVLLEGADHRIRLMVTDKGRGFSPESSAHKGLGIVSMEERVRLLAGTITIRTKPGDGTRVVVEIPLQEQTTR